MNHDTYHHFLRSDPSKKVAISTSPLVNTTGRTFTSIAILTIEFREKMKPRPD